MIFEDWRDTDAAEFERLYEAECERYRTQLSWDLAPSCVIVEEARRAGRLPGLVVRNTEGRAVGWTYFVVHEGTLQLGTLVADSAARLRELLDRVMQSPEARFARSLSSFLFPISPSLLSAFERQRFVVERHPYLSSPLVAASGALSPGGLGPEFRLQPLMDVDPADVVRLTARSYAGLAEARCFAPDGRLDQWAHYLGQLLATPACGSYLPQASFAIERRESRQVVGAVITTAVAPETAHIAQIVVDPSIRRAGLARELLGSVADTVRAMGYLRLTLIVSDRNGPARQLYAKLGFSETASFFFASRPALSRRSFQTASQVAAARG
ncbi:MAG TPA: GNAT family N-acetyltransferase [Vicinamibacterales bacterium]|jgi:ribosomal protein S18 acetylase RimI-like enzyme